jgi:hypothetical protein
VSIDHQVIEKLLKFLLPQSNGMVFVMEQDILPTPKYITRSRTGAVVTAKAGYFNLFE